MQLEKKNKSVDEDVVVATAMVFIMAGYDTTATLLSYGSYALAKNPEVQKRLQEEVDEALQRVGQMGTAEFLQPRDGPHHRG